MQFTVRIPQEYVQEIDRLSNKLGLKRSDIVRMAIKSFFENTQADDPQAPFERVSHLLGIAESGMKDLGQRHRDYLKSRIRKRA